MRTILILLSIFFLFSCKKNNAEELQQTTIETPAGLPATEISYTNFTMNWSSPFNYDSTQVFVANDTNFTQPIANYNPMTLVMAGSGGTGVIGLVPNTKYFYRARQFYNGKAGGFSNIVSVTTKNWDGQLTFGGNTNNITTHPASSGPVKYVELVVGTDYYFYPSLSISNVPDAASGTFTIKDGNGILDGYTIGATLRDEGNKNLYYSKAGGTITKTGLKSFTFSCPVYLDKDVNKTTIYTMTGNCIY